METASMPPRPPAETNALPIVSAQQELREPGSTSDKYTPEERAAGGIGYLNYLARKQQEKKDEASRAARYLKMMQGQEDIIRRANPAMGLAGIDTNQEFTTERSMKSPAQRLEEAVPGLGAAAARYAMSKNAPEAAAARIDERSERTRSNNPLVNLRSDLGEIGSYLRDILGFQEGGEVKKYAGEDESLIELTGGRTISTAAPESYTERRRREAAERAERSLAEQYPPREAEPAEMYEPSLGDVMLIQQAQEYLTDPRIRELQEIIRRGGQDYRVEAARQELESRRREIARTPIEAAPTEELTMAQRLMQLPRVERQPRQERREEGILSRLGSAVSSPRALAIADALSKLSYAGGATEGYMGRGLRSGLQAEEQAREKLRLQEEAIEADKLRSEATLEAGRQTQQAKLRADLVNELGKYEGSPTFTQDLNARMEATGEDRETARTAIMQAKIAELMPLLTGQGGLTQMAG